MSHLRPYSFNKDPQTKQPSLRGLWKHGDTEFTAKHRDKLRETLCLCVSVVYFFSTGDTKTTICTKDADPLLALNPEMKVSC